MPNEKFQIDFAGRALSAEFSDLAEHAHGSAIVRYGETMVMATAVMSDFKRENIDYFPLTVDYEEKFYAAGRILGSRFLRSNKFLFLQTRQPGRGRRQRRKRSIGCTRSRSRKGG